MQYLPGREGGYVWTEMPLGGSNPSRKGTKTDSVQAETERNGSRIAGEGREGKMPSLGDSHL